MKTHEDSGFWKKGFDTPSRNNSSTHLPTNPSTYPPSSEVAIRVEHVSKKYCKSLKRSMLYGVEDIGRNIVGLHSRSERLRKNEFWAVNDVSFEVKRGETLGIIGPNGAGKTTLLKMLNGIFWPDKGKITVRGRVGALIEVGAGFHPLLTGRENIYVNAAILGMTKEEVDEKFDEIIKFADIGDFLDTPVKFYSSGMFVRLGFAIAVHGEPDILLVDEVMAVGDSVFRNKCYKKMNEVKGKKDVAIIYVSHDLLTMGKFCDRGIFIANGIIKNQGQIHEAIQAYQSTINQLLERQGTAASIASMIPYCTKEVEIANVKFLDRDSKAQKDFCQGDALGIRIEYKANQIISNPIFQISLFNRDGVHISVFGTHIDNVQIKSTQGEGVIECWVDSIPLLLSKYYATVAIYDETHNITFDYWNGAACNEFFQVLPNRTSEKMAEYTPICKFNNKWIFHEKRKNV
jgi:lipopolysaccharide transport system ATP-binding protein